MENNSQTVSDLRGLFRSWVRMHTIDKYAFLCSLLLLLALIVFTIIEYSSCGIGKTLLFCVLEFVVGLVLMCSLGWVVGILIDELTKRRIETLCAERQIDRRSLFGLAQTSFDAPLSPRGEAFLELIDEGDKKRKDMSSMVVAFDLRPENERQVELGAEHDLGGEDEELARRICELQKQKEHRDEPIPGMWVKEVARQEIREIGEHLGRNGGDERMKKIAYRVQKLGGSSRLLETFWEGICGWMA